MSAEKPKPTIKRPKGIVVVKLNGRSVECVTVSMLAKICGVKPDTLRRYERAGLFPPANFRIPSKSPLQSKGNRLYTKELAYKVASVFEKSKQGIAMSEEDKQIIKQAFVKERENYLNNVVKK